MDQPTWRVRFRGRRRRSGRRSGTTAVPRREGRRPVEPASRIAALQSNRDEALDLLRMSAERGVGEEIRVRGYVTVGEEPDLVSPHGEREFAAILARFARAPSSPPGP